MLKYSLTIIIRAKGLDKRFCDTLEAVYDGHRNSKIEQKKPDERIDKKDDKNFSKRRESGYRRSPRYSRDNGYKNRNRGISLSLLNTQISKILETEEIKRRKEREKEKEIEVREGIESVHQVEIKVEGKGQRQGLLRKRIERKREKGVGRSMIVHHLTDHHQKIRRKGRKIRAGEQKRIKKEKRKEIKVILAKRNLVRKIDREIETERKRRRKKDKERDSKRERSHDKRKKH